MNTDRKKKLLRACEIVKKLTDRDTEVTKLMAEAMQTGYDLGKLEKTA